jgi:hypothetical protein
LGEATPNDYEKRGLTAYFTVVTYSFSMFLRRIGPDPHANGGKTAACNGCPDIWELENGDFAVIGSDITGLSVNKLPPTASCGPDERIIRIPRKTLLLAKPHIMDLT